MSVESDMAPPYRWVDAPSGYPGRVYYPSRRILEHHLVWWDATGTTVPRGYCLHHKDDVGMDNRIDNLELLTVQAHLRLHRKWEEDAQLTCGYCGANLTRTARDVRSKNRQGQQQFYCNSSHAAQAGHRDTVLPLTRKTKHGTSSGYRHGCRCEECRGFNAQRQRQQRQKQK